MDNNRRARTISADYTHTLVAALKALQGTDFSKWMGSGILVDLTPITPEKHLANEFMLPAEDMEEIKPLIIKSLRRHLELRKARLLGEIRDIEAALKL